MSSSARTFTSLLALASIFSATGARCVRAEEERIDTHVHLIYLAGHQKDGGTGRGPGGRPGRPGPGGGGAAEKGGVGASDYEAAAARLIEMMDRARVTKVIILPPPSAKNLGAKGAGDYREFIDLIAKYPGRLSFVGGGSLLNGMIQETAAEAVTEKVRQEFRRRAEEILGKGAKGFGEMTALHLSEGEGHPFEEVAPDHPLFLLLADIAAEKDVPIDFHMDAVAEDMDLPSRLSVLGTGNPKRLKGNLAAFERLLAHNGKARIVWQHAGSDPVGGMTVDLLRRLLKSHPNLFVALRSPNPRAMPENPRLLNTPVDETGKIRADWLSLFTEFPDRFMIGSDTFVSDGRDDRRSPFEGAWRFPEKLPADVAKRVAGGNAARVYGIE
ncbi:MAG: amidohydrolase family protein [Planctomycetes bacterium]|nr:amidohydrolase family protein [Planctomycetota bacterium]